MCSPPFESPHHEETRHAPSLHATPPRRQARLRGRPRPRLAVAPPPEAAAQASRRPLTVDDLWAVQRVGIPLLSPDGSQIAYTRDQLRHGREPGNADLWLTGARRRAPRRLTASKASDSAAAWSPDGTRLAFVSSRDADKAAQLYVLPAGRRRARAHDRHAHGRRDPALAARRQAHRLRRPRGRGRRVARGDEEGARGAREEQGQGARHREPALPLLGPLADGRGVPAPLRRRPRDARVTDLLPGSKRLLRPAGRRRRASTSRPTARPSRSRRTTSEPPLPRRSTPTSSRSRRRAARCAT